VAIVLPVIFIRKERTTNGGFITFGDAFKLSFIGLIIGGAIGVVFQILYIQVIDPEFAERMTAQTLEMSNNFMSGLDDEIREQILRDAEADSLARYTIVGQIKSFGIALVIYAVFSLILAAILKKNPEGNFGSEETLDA
jgi:carbon starvation protein CstA